MITKITLSFSATSSLKISDWYPVQLSVQMLTNKSISQVWEMLYHSQDKTQIVPAAKGMSLAQAQNLAEFINSLSLNGLIVSLEHKTYQSEISVVLNPGTSNSVVTTYTEEKIEDAFTHYRELVRDGKSVALQHNMD